MSSSEQRRMWLLFGVLGGCVKYDPPGCEDGQKLDSAGDCVAVTTDTEPTDTHTTDTETGTTSPDGDSDGWTVADGDCDDADGTVNPAAVEKCNGKDDDCDSTTDVGAVDALTWYADADGDDYGTGAAVVGCDPPTASAFVPGDCDDGNAAVHPGVEEVCNSTDDDCDGRIDDDAVGCIDTGVAVAFVTGSAEVNALGEFVSGTFGYDIVPRRDLPDLNSICLDVGTWSESGPLTSECLACDWYFSLVVSNATATGTHCAALGLDGSEWDAAAEQGWGFAESYTVVNSYGTYEAENVMFYDYLGTWTPWYYNIGSVGYNTGDRYSMTFHGYLDYFEYAYP